MKVVFMGTPEFARTALEAIVDAGHNVIGVITQPDKPKNRGHKLTPPPVKEAALAMGIPVYQPTTLKDGSFNDTLDAMDPDIIVVAAYGKILPKYFIDRPRYGCVNIHGSLLPKYRGAAPIQRAIMAGEKQIGITIMRMDEGLDTGDMMLTGAIDAEGKYYDEVHAGLSDLGAELIVKAMKMIEDGTVTYTKQNDAEMTYAAKITKEDMTVGFTTDADTVLRTVRALSPTAVTYLNGKSVKLVAARRIDAPAAEAGTVVALGAKGEGYIDVACAVGTVRLTRIIPEGKKEMSCGDFVRGRGISAGDKFTAEA